MARCPQVALKTAFRTLRRTVRFLVTYIGISRKARDFIQGAVPWQVVVGLSIFLCVFFGMWLAWSYWQKLGRAFVHLGNGVKWVLWDISRSAAGRCGRFVRSSWALGQAGADLSQIRADFDDLTRRFGKKYREFSEEIRLVRSCLGCESLHVEWVKGEFPKYRVPSAPINCEKTVPFPLTNKDF